MKTSTPPRHPAFCRASEKSPLRLALQNCARAIVLALLLTATLHADEYDTLRLKWRDILLGTGNNPADSDVASKLASIASAANTQWTAMNKAPSRTSLWSDLASTTNSAHVTSNYERLMTMARGYATPGSSLQGNADLLADILGGLEWMHANRYSATTAQYNNWWDWEIGAPLELNDICVLLYDQLPSTQLANYMAAVDHQTPTPDMTGANRVWKAQVVGLRACLVKSSAKLSSARDAFSAVFAYVTTGDGFYVDGSFIQHNYHPYTAGYGKALIETMAPVLNWLSGSTWAVVDPAQSNLYRWIFEAYEPIIYNGLPWDLVRGREANRNNSTPAAAGQSIMNSILQVAQFAPPAESLRMKRMLKEWAQKNYTRNFVSTLGLPTLAMAKALMADTSIAPRGELIGHYSFPSMDRVVHLGAGYGFGLSMSSTRIANFESINYENLEGWFTGDGHTTLYNGDLNAFADSYNFTVDAYRLPGVTADVTHSKLPAANGGRQAQGQSTRSPHSWAGGAALDRYGAAGVQFKGVGVTLTGKKSWFMFDDEIVCLGAGITSTDSRPIETTVEQRKINSAGTNAFTVDGVARSTALGWTEAATAVIWAHLAGHVTGADIGYYFPGSSALRFVREARTGALRDIDSAEGSSTPATRNYLRISLEHGSNPANAAYQYVLLPGRNATRTKQYAAAPQITILANNTNVQAVRETSLGITAANFWTDSSQTIGGITSNKKASVLVREDGPFIDVSVSDPTQLNTTGITLQIALNGGTLISADTGVSVTQTSPSIVMSVSTANSAGKTFKARFYKLPAQTVTLSPVADSYVYDDAAEVNSNFGAQPSVAIKAGSTGFNRAAYLRFDVPAATGALLGATLRLSCLSAPAPVVHAVAPADENTWAETGITWSNQPGAGADLDTWSATSLATIRANVTAAVPASGPVSFKVFAVTQASDGSTATYATKEAATSSDRPQLNLAYGQTTPDVSLSAPADGTVVTSGDEVTLIANASTSDGTIASVSFYDGETLLGTDTSSPFSLTVPLGGGLHYLKAVATGSNGLSRTSLTTVVEANSGLAVGLTAPLDGDIFDGTSNVPLTASASFTQGTVTSVSFYDGATLLGTDTSAPFSISVPLSGGVRTLTAVATSSTGITETSVPTRISVNVAPTPLTASAGTVSTAQSSPTDIDLLTLVSGGETPAADLRFQVGSPANGSVVLLADGHTARFTPTEGYSGAASFAYTVIDTTSDPRLLLNYAFQNSDVTDRSGYNRTGTLSVPGTGAANFVNDSPLLDYTKSLSMTENGTAGAARLERSLTTGDLDLQNSNWTFTGWFKRGATTNMDVIWHLGGSAGYGPSSLNLAFYGTSNTLELRNYNSANVLDLTIAKTNVSALTWHHFAVVRSGTSLSLYVDGTLAGSNSTAFSLGFTTTTTVKWGGSNSTTTLDRWFNGALADLAGFSAALASTDITKIYTRPVQWFGGTTESATVSVNVFSPIEVWRLTEFGTSSNTGLQANTADMDGDGLSNLLEYVCATNPNAANPNPVSIAPSGNGYEVVFTLNHYATDATYRVEWSETLGNDWSTAGVGVPEVVTDDGVKQLIKVTIPAGSSGRMFARLRVTRPE